MVTHHEVVTLGNDLGPPVIVAAEVARHEAVVEGNVVAEDTAVHDADLVAFLGNDPLDERFLRLERIVEHDDVADLGIAEPIRELVDDQPILILQRRRHAHAFHTRDLKAECNDERRVNGRGRQRFQPCDKFFAEAIEPHRCAIE